MSPRSPFPFPPPPRGEVTPWPGPGDRQELFRRDVSIVRWFLENGSDQPIREKPHSPLGYYLAMSEQMDLNGPSKTIEELEPDKALHGLHLGAAMVRIPWAVRALYGTEGAVGQVDASFIRAELLGQDSNQPGAVTLPAGVGTLVIAGRLVQAGLGCIKAIKGNRGAGYDIKWVTGSGDVVYVERKDRTYEAGLRDTPEDRVTWAIEKTREAGKRLPRERGAARVVVVGFQHLVRKREAKRADLAYHEALKRNLLGGRVPRDDLPHLVIFEHLGLEPKTGGEKFNFFSPQPLDFKRWPFMWRVGRLLALALGMRL